MQSLVEYLMNVVSYVYSTMFINWGGQAGTFEFQVAFVWILVILGIGFFFIFLLVPLLFKWIFSVFGRWGRS